MEPVRKHSRKNSMTRWIALVALQVVIGVSMGSQGHAQSPAPRSTFEVATVKLDRGCGNVTRGNPPSPGRLNMQCITLKDLIGTAYITFAHGPHPSARRPKILGGPSWIDSDRYEITAKAEDGAGLAQMAGPMLQVLLEERFKLTIHRETRELPIYTLTVAKGGLKPQALQEANCVPIDLNHLEPPAPGEPIPNFCDRQMFKRIGPNTLMDVYGASMTSFSDGLLSNRLDRPVIDKTGLAGRFDFHLEFAPDTAAPGLQRRGEPVDPGAPALPADTGGPSIFTALQEQLGLKLSADKGPVEVIVIDHVEKPAAN
jgi:uncharacterized protein (TIGR03435 family)